MQAQHQITSTQNRSRCSVTSKSYKEENYQYLFETPNSHHNATTRDA